MDRKKYVIFASGGSGTRMGAPVPKQFLLLNGIPVLQRSIEAFLEACPDISVITVLPAGMRERWRSLCNEHALDCRQQLVTGGLTRFHSVQRAIEKVPDGAVVAIHDGVRPLVSKAFLQEMFARMQDCRALIPVCPVTDTLKCLRRDADGSLHETGTDPDRSLLYGAQTPQMFRSEELRAAYSRAYELSFTDDASVARAYGIPLSYIAGERNNIKITTPDDLELAAAILSLRG